MRALQATMRTVLDVLSPSNAMEPQSRTAKPWLSLVSKIDTLETMLASPEEAYLPEQFRSGCRNLVIAVRTAGFFSDAEMHERLMAELPGYRADLLYRWTGLDPAFRTAAVAALDALLDFLGLGGGRDVELPPLEGLHPDTPVGYDDGMQPGDSKNVPKKRVTITKAAGEVLRHRAPSHQPGYERSNRKGGMVGLGVELPKALRDQVVKAAIEWEMSKQQYVTALLVAAIAEHKPKPGEPLPLPEAFKGDVDALRRATKLFIASLK
jgi:hypothetical protein